MGCVALGGAGAAQASGPVREDEPPLVTAGRAPRSHREVAWVRHGPLDAAQLTDWTAIYDHDTGVPVRLWGPGQAAPGSVTSAAVAEAWARGFLAAHLGVLAPGASPEDFVVVANQLDARGELRSVGFAQRAHGLAVLGGTVSFAFKHDRMIMSGSTALPNLPAQLPGVRSSAPIAASRVIAAATAWLAAAGRPVVARQAVAAERVIVPIVHTRGAGGVDIEYTVAEQVEVTASAGAPGRWTVFVDATTCAAFARMSTLMFESGTLMFDVPDRGPLASSGRHPRPAPGADLDLNGVAVTSGPDGSITWTGGGHATLSPGLSGPRVAIHNAGGALATDTLGLDDGGSVTWSRAGEPAVDAQLDAFVYASQVKQFVQRQIDPALAYLEHQLSVYVNETPGSCNAYSTGDDLHFFPQTPGMCENTARLADVVYHEFGHSLHRQSIIDGVGQFDGEMSEGVGDTLAVAMTGDPGLGRGFFLTNEPLRDLDPIQKKRWPGDLIGEVHQDGEIYGEAMWDLRTALQARLGDADGFARFLHIYHGTVQRAVDIPSSFAEALVADDDDGDLSNGTPNECDIIAAFQAHGLYDPTVTGEVGPSSRDGFAVALATTVAASARCQVPVVRAAAVTWRMRGGSLATIPLVADGAMLRATIPSQPAGSVIEYSLTATLADGTTQSFPGNRADPYYQFYVGAAMKIWCADFEQGAADWTHSATPAAQDRWQVGPPRGLGGDPAVAEGGHAVLGLALDGDGRYAPLTATAAVSPVIALGGNTKVHLQYYRWLGVEDGVFDQAVIRANGVSVWHNYASAITLNATVASESYNLIDHEWRFQDIDVSAEATAGTIQLAFELTSDPGFEAGGWNLDDVCLVATGASCGNSVVEVGEACDDGNTLAGDGCSASCQDEAPAAGGCCSTGGDPAAALAVAAITLGIARRRRRGPG